MAESTPTHPNAGRYWQIVEDLGVSILYTSPTALRTVAQDGRHWVEQHDLSSLRILGLAGEQVPPDLWRWYADVVGRQRCPVIDTWGQTETGGMMIAPIAGLTPIRPGSAGVPLFGIEPVIVDDEGRELEGDEVSGNLCFRRPWPGQARSIWGDHSRFRHTYFSRFPGLYFTGDGCRRDAEGLYWITGRVDDVLTVSGQRLGTAEIESALLTHDAVAEAAVVGYPHDLKGTGICAFIRVAADYAGPEPDELVGTLKERVRHVIGSIATPDRIEFCSRLPKTRTGKIPRPLLREIVCGHFEETADLSDLDDSSVVRELVAALREKSRQPIG
jgi:acetyl-CoA synthetase